MIFNDSQYDELMDTYAQNQIKNKIALRERKLEVYEKIPRIQEIDQTIASSSIDAIRAKLQHGTDKMSEQEERRYETGTSEEAGWRGGDLRAGFL